MSGLITQQKMKTLKDNRPMPEPKISPVKQDTPFQEELRAAIGAIADMRSLDHRVLWDTLNAVIARAAESKQDNPEDINISDIGLRKHAVLQTAKQIFIQLMYVENHGVCSPVPRTCIQLAEDWHTAQEEYINKE